MTPQERMTIDHLNFELVVAENIYEERQEGLERLLEILEAHAGELMPTHVSLSVPDVKRWKRKRSYSRAIVHQMVREEWAEEKKWTGVRVVVCVFEKSSRPDMQLEASFFNNPKANYHFTLSMKVMPFTFFTDPAHTEARSQAFLTLVRAWAIQFPPLYAVAHSYSDRCLSADPNTTGTEPTYEQPHEVYWLNVLGKEMVERLGRERVLSTPAHRVEALPGGSVLLVPHPTAEFASEAARQRQARALAHLRPELSYESTLARLRERSEALVPVTPAFHPSVSSFLTRTLERQDVWQRPREIARLNAYRPPEVSQWMPLSEAPPADVVDVEEAILQYGFHAELLVAIL